MNIAQIEKNVTELLNDVNKDEFIYDLLLAYGKPKSSIKRLQSGNLNISTVDGEVSWKKEVFFKSFEGQLITDNDLDEVLAEAVKNIKHNQRFILVTDFKRFLAFDTKTIDRLDIDFKDLAKNYAFLLPWAGMEKAQHLSENPADVKAAERMAKLFDELKKDNIAKTPEEVHHLNVFLSRLLFCFFAEDTNIFDDNLFTKSIESHTQKDGSDLHTYLNKVFDVLNLPEGGERENLPKHLKVFPYVNGGLFADTIQCPEFSKKSRQLLIDSGTLDWKGINPDIFGSMFQAVITDDQRGTLGQHYTSVPNIMKVIQPLFLDELYEAFEEAKGNAKKISALLQRLRKIKVFDPACGSGNFLIIAYKELRKLEMKIFKESGQIPLSGISLSQFYGIEIDDFAHEIAILALWLAEHQMNVEFFNEFGRTNPTLPLKAAGKIEQGNACRLDWEVVCPKDSGEVYIIGNPPYLGSSLQTKTQKEDMEFVLSKMIKKYKNLDYITCWFIKGAHYIRLSKNKLAFVSTNSITQGEQVSLLWPELLKTTDIIFAHKSFKWINSAKKNAGVSVIVLALKNIEHNERKFIIDGQIKRKVNNITPYLSTGKNIIVAPRSTNISHLEKMISGNKPVDGGHLILSVEEKKRFEKEDSRASKFIKQYIGATEFMNGKIRYCLWIDDSKLNEALSISLIKSRIEANAEFRLKSKDKGARDLSKKAHQFRDFFKSVSSTLVIPQTGSERRRYIPIGFLDSDFILSNGVRTVFDGESYLFSVLSSKQHIVWVRAIAGRLKMDMQYSNTLCYNTFPFLKISNEKKLELEQAVKKIIKARANHSQLTLAQMYDPDKMPDDLREAHHQNDILIDSCYRDKPFSNDEERLEHLFKLYEKMITKEQRELEKPKKKKA